MVHLCRQCLATGVQSVMTHTEDHFVACTVCGAIDEVATSVRNSAQVSEVFGTILADDVRTSRFKELREKQHEEFVDDLLNIYLVDPKSRIVHIPAGHFKAGARSWYNKMRAAEEAESKFKHATTNNNARKVKYRVVVAILYTIQDSNITLVNNRLSRVKKSPSSASSSFRGDGKILAPTISMAYHRLSALGEDHIGYLDSQQYLQRTHYRLSRMFKRRPMPVDMIMSQVMVMGRHVERLCKLPWAERLTQLSHPELKPAAKRKGVTLKTAKPDEFALDTTTWDYMASVDWQKSLEASYHLYCASRVVDLWGHRSSTDYASSLFFWGIQCVKGTAVPMILYWSREIAGTYGGNEYNALARRSELKDFLVGWSSSFPDANLPVPLIEGPPRGKIVGNGVRGWAGDNRRAIPEIQMAIAAAPVIAQHWRTIAITRLQTRTAALLLNTEYTMAAKMMAAAWKEANPRRKRNPPRLHLNHRGCRSAPLLSSGAPSRATSAQSSRASSLAPSLSGYASTSASAASTSRGSSRGASPSPAPSGASSSRLLNETRSSMSRDDMLLRMMNAVSPPPQSREPTIEELLATHDDSSDEEMDGETEGELRGTRSPRRTLPLGDAPSAAPFAFSIGPNGSFSVAADDNPPTPVVRVSHKRAPSATNTNGSPAKRSRPAVPFSPPLTGRSPSPAPSFAPSIASLAADAVRSVRGYSATPSLREVGDSREQSPYVVPSSVPGEDDVARYACLLLRERDQYVSYGVSNERGRGLIMPKDIEDAIVAWVKEAKGKGRIPTNITPEYLASLEIYGDPRMQDLGPFIRRNAHRWSPTECLLRLGLQPIEFPLHLAPNSHAELKRHFEWGTSDSTLALDDELLDNDQLNAELDQLFSVGMERWQDILRSKSEANAKEKLLVKQGIWKFDRNTREGPSGNELHPTLETRDVRQAEAGARAARRSVLTATLPNASSKRINYDALARLMAGDDKTDEKLEEMDDDDATLQSLLDDSIMAVVGVGPEDKGDEFDGGEDDYDDGGYGDGGEDEDMDWGDH